MKDIVSSVHHIEGEAGKGWKVSTECFDNNDDGILSGSEDYATWEFPERTLFYALRNSGGGTHRGWLYGHLVIVYLNGRQVWFPSDYFKYDKADDEEILKLAKYKEIDEEAPKKNLCGKMISLKDLDKAYEVWQSEDGSWTWYCLKKYQIDDEKPYARWFCMVKTPYVPEGEAGDVYVSEIKANAKRIK